MGRKGLRIRTFVARADDNLSSMKILVVGLGAIGAGFGFSAAHESHLSVTSSLGYEIAGGVDIDQIRQQEFKRITGKPVFGDLTAAISTVPNVIVIASNPETHLSSLISAIKYFPEATIVCEKPFGSNGSESRSMLELILGSETQSYVNFSRQFSKGFQVLKGNIQGDLKEGTVTYNLGLARSCSHYIRLCLGLFGPIKGLQNIGNQWNCNNPSFQLLFENNSTVDFIGVSDSNIRIADFNLITSQEIITITEGMNWKVLENKNDDSPMWPRDLDMRSSGDFSGGLKRLYLNILNKKVMPDMSTSKLDASPNLIIDQILAHV